MPGPCVGALKPKVRVDTNDFNASLSDADDAVILMCCRS